MADVYTNSDKHVLLYNNVKLPILGLGTSHDGGYSHDAVVFALQQCGYRHIDTAKRYGCETYIADAVKASGVPREDIFLATKCWPADYGGAKTREAFNGSCQRLGTDYLDMYMLHWPEVPSGAAGDKRQVLRDTWRALEVLLDEGRVRAIGVSNFLERHLDPLLEDCCVTPHLNQCEFHPFNNPKQLRNYCKDRSIQFEGYSPLAKGRVLRQPQVLEVAQQLNKTPSQVLLRWSLQHNIPALPKSTKLNHIMENSKGYCPLGNGQILREPRIREIAETHGKSPAQVLIRWNLQQGVVCIPKSTKEHRVKENAQVFDFSLSEYCVDMFDALHCDLHVSWNPNVVD